VKLSIGAELDPVAPPAKPVVPTEPPDGEAAPAAEEAVARIVLVALGEASELTAADDGLELAAADEDSELVETEADEEAELEPEPPEELPGATYWPPRALRKGVESLVPWAALL